MIYTVTLNPALDYVMKVGALRSEDIIRADGAELYYGGKGINVSVVLSRLGIESTALGFAAGFTGRELERRLAEDGIKCDFIFSAQGSTRINVKIRADREYDINADGPAVSEEDVEALLEKLGCVKDGDWLVLAGSAPKGVSDNIYERILRRLKGRDIKVSVDASGDLLLRVLKFRPFLIKPNHIELGELFGAEMQTDGDIVRCAKKLQSLGAENVLVSRAEKGAILVDCNGSVLKTGNAEGVHINSTGCGDSMVAGFIAGYIQTGDYDFALRLGTACGNATAYSESLADKSKIEKCFASLNNPLNKG